MSNNILDGGKGEIRTLVKSKQELHIVGKYISIEMLIEKIKENYCGTLQSSSVYQQVKYIFPRLLIASTDFYLFGQ